VNNYSSPPVGEGIEARCGPASPVEPGRRREITTHWWWWLLLDNPGGQPSTATDEGGTNPSKRRSSRFPKTSRPDARIRVRSTNGRKEGLYLIKIWGSPDPKSVEGSVERTTSSRSIRRLRRYTKGKPGDRITKIGPDFAPLRSAKRYQGEVSAGSMTRGL